jgi:mitogen-activated protein kinase organizer 1
LTGHVSRVTSVLCLPDHTDLLATGSFDQTVRLWDKRSYSRFPVQVLEGARDGVESVDMRNQLLIAVASADGFVRVYDIRKGVVHADAVGFDDITASRSKYDAVMRVRLGQDGAYYAASTIRGAVKMVDLDEDATILQSFTTPADNPDSLRTTAMAFDKNEERVLIGCVDGRVYGFDTVTGERSELVYCKSPVLSMDYNISKKIVGVGCLNGEYMVTRI